MERGGRQPGDLLLHPVGWLSLGLWIVNDHVLKAAWPGLWTGKLSDVACLIAFPLLCVSAFEVLSAALGGRWMRSGAALGVALLLAGGTMVAINLWEPAAWVYRHGLGLAQWPFFCLSAALRGAALPSPGTVSLTMDPSDVWTLPSLAAAWWVHRAGRASVARVSTGVAGS